MDALEFTLQSTMKDLELQKHFMTTQETSLPRDRKMKRSERVGERNSPDNNVRSFYSTFKSHTPELSAQARRKQTTSLI